MTFRRSLIVLLAGTPSLGAAGAGAAGPQEGKRARSGGRQAAAEATGIKPAGSRPRRGLDAKHAEPGPAPPGAGVAQDWAQGPVQLRPGIITTMYKNDDIHSGWVKPVAKPTRESLRARVAELRAELTQAEAQLREMEEGDRLEALVKVRNLMRAFELTPEDLGFTQQPNRRGRPPKNGNRQ